MALDSFDYFTVTDEHIKLLRAANVSWEDCEYGAPAIDCKRPYGNSSVTADIVDILGWPYEQDEDGDWNDDNWQGLEGVDERARAVHEGTRTALQIALATGSFEPGDYRAPKYTSRWERVPDGGRT